MDTIYNLWYYYIRSVPNCTQSMGYYIPKPRVVKIKEKRNRTKGITKGLKEFTNVVAIISRVDRDPKGWTATANYKDTEIHLPTHHQDKVIFKEGRAIEILSVVMRDNILTAFSVDYIRRSVMRQD